MLGDTDEVLQLEDRGGRNGVSSDGWLEKEKVCAVTLTGMVHRRNPVCGVLDTIEPVSSHMWGKWWMESTMLFDVPLDG